MILVDNNLESQWMTDWREGDGGLVSNTLLSILLL